MDKNVHLVPYVKNKLEMCPKKDKNVHLRNVPERTKMFTDYTKIIIKSGNGGNGAATFRREKYVAAGGPDRTEMVEMGEISISKLTKIRIH